MTQHDLEQAMAVQVLSPLAMMRSMKKTGHPAQIINILDARIMDNNPNHASYHLAKRSLWQLTQDLAIEYAPEIRVNAVAPGIILPPGGKGPDWLDRLSSSNPLRTPWKSRGCIQCGFIPGAGRFCYRADYFCGWRAAFAPFREWAGLKA